MLSSLSSFSLYSLSRPPYYSHNYSFHRPHRQSAPSSCYHHHPINLLIIALLTIIVSILFISIFPITTLIFIISSVIYISTQLIITIDLILILISCVLLIFVITVIILLIVLVRWFSGSATVAASTLGCCKSAHRFKFSVCEQEASGYKSKTSGVSFELSPRHRRTHIKKQNKRDKMHTNKQAPTHRQEIYFHT